MKKIKDISPKLSVKPAYKELARQVTPGELPLAGNMGGMQFFSNSFKRGQGNEVFSLSDKGLHLGAAEFDDAPFSVDFSGNAILNSVTIPGYIEDGGAAADVNANATTISGGKITANSITASKLDVSTLSAISANIGTVTAGNINGLTITGGTLRTAASGQRIQLTGSDNKLTWYDSSGNKAGEIDDGDLNVYASGGSLIGTLAVIGGAYTLSSQVGISLIPNASYNVQVSGKMVVTSELRSASVIKGANNGTSGSGNAFLVGDDAYLRDINTANTMAVWGAASGTYGNINADNFNNISARSTKNNIEPLRNSVLEGIKKLQIRTYRKNRGPAEEQTHPNNKDHIDYFDTQRVGLISDEIPEELSTMLKGDAISLYEYITYVAKAVQELAEIIDEQ